MSGFCCLQGTILSQGLIHCTLGAFSLVYEPNHSLPFSAKVKNAVSCISTSPYAFLAWCVLKHRDNFNDAELQDCYVQTCNMVVQKCPEAQSWTGYLMMWFTSLKHSTLNGTQICLFLIYCTAENILYFVGKIQQRLVSFYF